MAKKRGEPKSVEHTLPLSDRPIQRNAANARERSRMRVLSRAFGRLKTSLPWVPPDTKLSKLDTLRLASTYIAHLRKILRTGDSESAEDSYNETSSHPIVLTWPFSIHNKPDANEDIVCRSRNQDVDSYGYSDYESCEIIAKNSSHDSHHFNKTIVGHCLQ